MKLDHPVESRGPRRSERLRQRAAWMYFVEEMTQSAIADALGVGRVTVVRMLAEAKALGEVRIALSRGHAELGGLEASLCTTFDFDEALVAPMSSADADATAPIGAVLGEYLSALLRNDMKIGLGWGRTLNRSLEHLRERSLRGLNVISLVGGVTHFAHDNPAEFPSAFARAFNADCYLIPSPALVDSPATKTALIERCGLRARLRLRQCARRGRRQRRIARPRGDDRPVRADRRGGPAHARRIRRASASCSATSTTTRAGSLDHPLNQRVMSVPMEAVRAAPIRVLAAGGVHKLAAIEGAIKLLHPTALVTDEITARKLTKIPV